MWRGRWRSPRAFKNVITATVSPSLARCDLLVWTASGSSSSGGPQLPAASPWCTPARMPMPQMGLAVGGGRGGGEGGSGGVSWCNWGWVAPTQ